MGVGVSKSQPAPWADGLRHGVQVEGLRRGVQGHELQIELVPLAQHLPRHDVAVVLRDRQHDLVALAQVVEAPGVPADGRTKGE